MKACEFNYHKTCLHWTSMQRRQPSVDLKEKEVREQCFGLLKGYIQEKVIDEGTILRISAISEAYQLFQRIFHLFEKGDKNHKLKKRLLKSFEGELSFFQRTPGSSELVNDSKDCQRKKESIIKDMVRQLGASIKELKSTSVWLHDLEYIYHVDMKISKLLQLF